MLTKETLKANKALKDLTEEQLTTISTMSENDENSVIAKKTGEIYGQLDSDIKEASGIDKNGTEKTYDYAKRVISKMATSSKSSSSEIEKLTNKVKELKQVIKDGAGDEQTKKDLEQSRKDFESMRTKYNTLLQESKDKEEQFKKDIFSRRVQAEIDGAVGSMKFKKDINPNMKELAIANISNKLKGMNPEYIKDEKTQKEVLVFKDADGAIIRNKENKMFPFTSTELVQKQLKDLDMLDMHENHGGSGTHPAHDDNHHNNSLSFDLSGCTTKEQATETIRQTLLSQGFTAGSEEYQNAMDNAWEENNVDSLPLN